MFDASFNNAISRRSALGSMIGAGAHRADAPLKITGRGEDAPKAVLRGVERDRPELSDEPVEGPEAGVPGTQAAYVEETAPETVGYVRTAPRRQYARPKEETHRFDCLADTRMVAH